MNAQALLEENTQLHAQVENLKTKNKPYKLNSNG